MKKFLAAFGACIIGIGSTAFCKVNAEDYTVTLLGSFNSDTHVVAQRIIEKADQEQSMFHYRINLLNDSITIYDAPCQETYRSLALYDLSKSKVAVIVPDYRDAESLSFIKLWIDLVKESNPQCRIVIGALGASDCIQRAFSYADILNLVKSMGVKEASVVDVSELGVECLYSQIELACTAEKFCIDDDISSDNETITHDKSEAAPATTNATGQQGQHRCLLI